MSTSDGEYEWNNRQDWIAFKREVQDLYDGNLNLTIRDLMRITGGDYDDIKAALMEDK